MSPDPGADVWSRTDALGRLREALLALTDEENSMCRIAAQRGIFCRGFARWDAREFDRRWRSAIGRSTHLSRAQMEEFANLWQLTGQVRQGVSLSCDARWSGCGPCRGWGELSNAEISRSCADLLGKSIAIV